MNWQLVLISLSIISAVVAFALAWLSWRRRAVSGATEFMWLMLAGGLWALLYAVELANTDLATVIIWNRTKQVAIILVPVAWLAFTVRYTDNARITSGILFLIAIVPIITVVLALTNWNQLYIRQATLVQELGVPSLLIERGPANIIASIYGTTLMVVGIAMLGILAARSFSGYRSQALLLAVAALVPLVGTLLAVVNVTTFDLAPLLLIVVGFLIGFGLLRLRLFDLVPVAYNRVIAGLPDGVLVLNTDKRIMALNPAVEQLFGLSETRVIGQPVKAVLPRIPLDKLEAQSPETPYEWARDDRFIELRYIPLQHRRSTEGYLVTLRDITDRTQTETQRRRQTAELQMLYDRTRDLESLKSDMIRMAAHDLNNPLAMVIGYLTLLQTDSELLKADHRDYVLTMLKQTDRMNNIISDILSLERIERLAESGNDAVCNLSSEVQAAASQYSDQAARKGQQFVVTVTDDIAVRGDAAQIREALTNLISNAIKYTPDGGHIEVILARDDTLSVFKVVDNGFGIPAAEHDRLFRPFHRVKQVETRDVEGTGLGLHLVKQVVERHGGTLIFESEHGKGSTFGFRLPLIIAEVDAAQAT